MENLNVKNWGSCTCIEQHNIANPAVGKPVLHLSLDV